MVSRTSRIRKMERSFNRVQKAVAALEHDMERLACLEGDIAFLKEYQDSGLWLEDFEADERGELPPDLRRGVLSEDGLYNLFDEIENIRK